MIYILRFLGLYKSFTFQVILSIFLSFITILAGAGLLAVSGWFITSMAIAGAAGVSMNYFAPAAIIRALSITRIAGRYAERLITHDCALKVSGAFRGWFFRKIEPLAPEGLKDLYSADIFARMRSDTDVLEKFYLNSVVPFLAGLVSLCVLFFIFLTVHPAWALYQAQILLLCGIGFPVFLLYVGRKDQARLQDVFQKMRTGLNETMAGMGDALVYQGMEYQEKIFQDYSNALFAIQKRIQRRESLLVALITSGMGFGVTGALYFISSNPDLQDKADLGMAPLLAIASFDAIAMLPAAFQAFFLARRSADRIFSITDRQIAVPASNLQHLEPGIFHLEARNLSFKYASLPVFNGIDFVLEAGSVLILTGRSGAGKSTITQLLSGFISPPLQSLFLQGRDVALCDPEQIRSFFSVAPQKTYLFNETIAKNLLIANPAASQEDLEDICRIACLDDVIASFPAGYQTFLGENGARLSGGQVRRLAIARAMLKKSSCLILDEPLEGLERELQIRLLQNILQRARQKNQAVLLCLHEMDDILKGVGHEVAL